MKRLTNVCRNNDADGKPYAESFDHFYPAYTKILRRLMEGAYSTGQLLPLRNGNLSSKRLILCGILSLRDVLLGYNFLFHSTWCKNSWTVAPDTSRETESIRSHSSDTHYNSFPNPNTPKRHACSHQTLPSTFYSVHASISIVSSPSKPIP